MSETSFIHILIAEDNEISREMMAGILRSRGYSIHGAEDGQSAIETVRAENIDLALVDLNMAPKGGFEFVKFLVAQGIKIPVVIVTADDSSDILTTANSLGVRRVLQKPVEPERLLKTVEQILQRAGVNTQALAVETRETRFSPETLMQRAIDLADQNAQENKGGPFGAVLASADGQILGEGMSGLAARADPIAHAEVMAIRKGAEKRGRTDLSGCVLYCSSEPTKTGKALIESVGIQKVYYGLSQEDVGKLLPRARRETTTFEQMNHDAALKMLRKHIKN